MSEPGHAAGSGAQDLGHRTWGTGADAQELAQTIRRRQSGVTAGRDPLPPYARSASFSGSYGLSGTIRAGRNSPINRT